MRDDIYPALASLVLCLAFRVFEVRGKPRVGTRRLCALRVVVPLPKIRLTEFFRSGNPTSENLFKQIFQAASMSRVSANLSILPQCLHIGAACCKRGATLCDALRVPPVLLGWPPTTPVIAVSQLPPRIIENSLTGRYSFSGLCNEVADLIGHL